MLPRKSAIALDRFRHLRLVSPLKKSQPALLKIPARVEPCHWIGPVLNGNSNCPERGLLPSHDRNRCLLPLINGRQSAHCGYLKGRECVPKTTTRTAPEFANNVRGSQPTMSRTLPSCRPDDEAASCDPRVVTHPRSFVHCVPGNVYPFYIQTPRSRTFRRGQSPRSQPQPAYPLQEPK